MTDFPFLVLIMRKSSLQTLKTAFSVMSNQIRIWLDALYRFLIKKYLLKYILNASVIECKIAIDL